MNESNPVEHRIETASALAAVSKAGAGERHAAYVGLDVHEETIAVAVAGPGREEPGLSGRDCQPAQGGGEAAGQAE